MPVIRKKHNNNNNNDNDNDNNNDNNNNNNKNFKNTYITNHGGPQILSDEGPTLDTGTLDFTIRIGSTTTLVYHTVYNLHS